MRFKQVLKGEHIYIYLYLFKYITNHFGCWMLVGGGITLTFIIFFITLTINFCETVFLSNFFSIFQPILKIVLKKKRPYNDNNVLQNDSFF